MLNNANVCPTGDSYQSYVDMNCDAGLMFTDSRARLMKSPQTHTTQIFSAEGELLKEVRNDGLGTQCGGAYSEAMNQEHDQEVRDFLDTLVGVPDDPCKTNNGGCTAQQTCTNNRGSAACDCIAGYTKNKEGQCLQGIVLQSTKTNSCVRISDTGGMGTTTICDLESTSFPTMAGSLFSYIDQTIRVNEKCITVKTTTASVTLPALSACSGAANQQWQCLAGGEIRSKLGTDLFLRNDFRQVNTTKTTTAPGDLTWQTLGKPDCKFCQVFDGTCGGGGSNDGGNNDGATSSSTGNESMKCMLPVTLLLLSTFLL